MGNQPSSGQGNESPFDGAHWQREPRRTRADEEQEEPEHLEGMPPGFNRTLWLKISEPERQFLISCNNNPDLNVTRNYINLTANPHVHMHLYKEDVLYMQVTARCADENPGGGCHPGGTVSISGCHQSVPEANSSARTTRVNKKVRDFIRENCSAWGTDGRFIPTQLEYNHMASIIAGMLASYNRTCANNCDRTDCNGYVRRGGVVGKKKKYTRKVKRTKKSKRIKKTKRRNSK